ncbi:ATP-binding protein [Chloroflexota bacterium]
MVSPAYPTINASVSKGFFVEMLVKDISLPMAIHDLIDNCIDGALKLKGKGKLDGLEINLKLSNREFLISDNCGGIDLDTATNYAFRFGRPKEAPGTSHSIGRFGVGLKRAVFKLGQHFTVLSTSEKSIFEVEVDVPVWERTKQWEFVFKSVEQSRESIADVRRGSTIRVTKLFDSVVEQFSLDHFLNTLRLSISERYQIHLERGISIKVNGLAIISAPIQFLVFKQQLLPAFKEVNYNGVSVREFVGIGEPKPDDAGWYVYCNGRMILRADQSGTTGWGRAGVERLPKYHNYFARFRGCVYFDSDDPASLPWNTTKDDVDHESGIYRSVLVDMVTLMKPVIAFLRDAAKERDDPEGFRPLNDLIALGQPVPVAKIKSQDTFIYEKSPPRPRGPRMIAVKFDKPIDLVEKVKRSLSVTSARAAGEGAFDYYVEMELDE